MTREEAIENLNMISVAFVEPVTKEQRKLIDDTFDMAIKALEQEPSGDLISRTEVRKFVEYIQSIKDNHNENQTPINYGTICDIVIEGWNLLKLSPVNPQEPKTGHWDSRTCKCSECGYQIAFSEYAERKYKYCPNCGARMVEQKESDNCRDCKKWEDCPCGKDGHESGTSQGYSIGECKDFEPQESEE